MTNKNEDPNDIRAGEQNDKGSDIALNTEELDELDSLEEAVGQHEPPVPAFPVVQSVRTLAMRLERKHQPWIGFAGLLSLSLSFLFLGGVVALLRLQVVVAFDTPLSPGVATGVVMLMTMTAFLLGLGLASVPARFRVSERSA